MASAPTSGASKAQHESEDLQSTADMTAFVQNLLAQMQDRFQKMSDSIISKMDEMGCKVDDLEKCINDLKAEMGAETDTAAAKKELNESDPVSME